MSADNEGLLPAVLAVGVLAILTVLSLVVFAKARKALVGSRQNVVQLLVAGTALVWLGSVVLLIWAVEPYRV